MNQILFTGNSNNYKNRQNVKKNDKKNYTIILLISICFVVILGFIIVSFNIKKQNNKHISSKLAENYETLKLYTNFDSFKNIYTSTDILNKDSLNKNSENINYIIGNIIIPSLDLNLPFFSYLDDSYLSISPCRFFGEMPPNYGNLCIAGHNYDNNEFFSNLNRLKKDDQIIIYDNSEHQYSYKIYNIFEVKENDLSPIYDFDINKHTLTLVTCNNLNKNRLIVKALMY